MATPTCFIIALVVVLLRFRYVHEGDGLWPRKPPPLSLPLLVRSGAAADATGAVATTEKDNNLRTGLMLLLLLLSALVAGKTLLACWMASDWRLVLLLA